MVHWEFYSPLLAVAENLYWCALCHQVEFSVFKRLIGLDTSTSPSDWCKSTQFRSEEAGAVPHSYPANEASHSVI